MASKGSAVRARYGPPNLICVFMRLGAMSLDAKFRQEISRVFEIHRQGEIKVSKRAFPVRFFGAMIKE